MIIELLPDPPDSFLMNCLIKGKNSGTDGPLFVAKDGVVMCRLDGYAIIPIEEYDELSK